MSNSQYLIKRGNVWFAVLEVPKPLRAAAGLNRYKQSLKTSSLAEANRLKLPLIDEWKRKINLLERHKADPLASLRATITRLRAEVLSVPDVWEDDEERGPINMRQEYISDALEALKGIAETHGDPIARQARAVILDNASFVRDLFPTWLTQFEGAEQTRDQHKYAVERFLDWAGTSTTAQSVNRKMAGEYIDKLLAESGLSRRTIERHASSLSSLWRWLLRRGHVEGEVNPWLGHALGKKSKKAARKALSPDAMLKLLKATYKPSGARATQRYTTVLPDVLRIALATGMRLGEICALERSDIQRREDGLWINIEKGKTEAAERLVPVHGCIVPLIERRLAEGDQYLIGNLVPGGPDKKRSWHVSKAYGRFRKLAGVKDKGQDFHATRNTFIDNLEGRGVPESTVKLIVGHERDSMTFGHYSKGESVDRREAINRLDYGTQIMAAISA